MQNSRTVAARRVQAKVGGKRREKAKARGRIMAMASHVWRSQSGQTAAKMHGAKSWWRRASTPRSKKHSSMGCAVVTMTDHRIRQAVLNALGTETTISGIKVKLKPHFDKETDQEVHTDIFVGWGRQVEKATPLAEKDIADHFDQLADQLANTGR